jgi:hypothetical protein
MKNHSRRRVPVVSLLLLAVLLSCFLSRTADAQTEERIETGRYGTGELALPSDMPEQAGHNNRWLYLDARLGPSMRFYIPPGDIHYTGNDTPNFSFDTAIQANLPLLPFLSIQGEVIFTRDNASRKNFIRNSGGQIEEYTQNYTSFFLQVPLLLRLNFYPGKFRVSPFFGLYYIAALGHIQIEDHPDNQRKSWTTGYFRPLGCWAA